MGTGTLPPPCCHMLQCIALVLLGSLGVPGCGSYKQGWLLPLHLPGCRCRQAARVSVNRHPACAANLLWLPRCCNCYCLHPRWACTRKLIMCVCLHTVAQRELVAPLQLQAAVALLVCASEGDCYSAVRELDQAVPDGERCVLHLDSRYLGDDKGALQVRRRASL